MVALVNTVALVNMAALVNIGSVVALVNMAALVNIGSVVALVNKVYYTVAYEVRVRMNLLYNSNCTACCMAFDLLNVAHWQFRCME